MVIETQKYIRKPLYVDAVRITSENFNEIATWCQGTQEYEPSVNPNVPGKKYIRVRVHNPKNPRQSRAYVGDWLLYTERGYKVYTNKAFYSAFDLINPNEIDIPIALEQGFESPVTFVPATPQSIAEAVIANESAMPTETVESVPAQEKVEPAAAEGRHVLSVHEQQNMTQEEIRDLVQSGEAVLAQDIAKS